MYIYILFFSWFIITLMMIFLKSIEKNSINFLKNYLNLSSKLYLNLTYFWWKNWSENDQTLKVLRFRGRVTQYNHLVYTAASSICSMLLVYHNLQGMIIVNWLIYLTNTFYWKNIKKIIWKKYLTIDYTIFLNWV